MGIKILKGDCRKTLQSLPGKSINTCITSPPYWGLRDYGEGEQLGLEETPEAFVENLVEVFREVKRVLRDDGTVWLNLGDTFLPNKQLGCIPFKVAIALQQDGWILRQDIIWHKPNPMPESVTDRCTKAHEYIFLLSKNPNYYFDNETIKQPAKWIVGDDRGKRADTRRNKKGMNSMSGITKAKVNKRSVWTVTTKPFKGAHFATFPKDLIEPCVLAGCPGKVCVDCNEPYVRQVESKRLRRNELPKDDSRYRPNTYEGSYKDINGKADAGYTETKDLGLQKQCQCKSNETKSGTVLDPFGGSGTTAQVANGHNRDAILIELNEEYIEIAKQRISPMGDMLNEVEVI